MCMVQRPLLVVVAVSIRISGIVVVPVTNHNLVSVVADANDAARMSRTLKCVNVLNPESSQFEEHETQRLLEEQWDNKTAMEKFSPLIEKNLKKREMPFHEIWCYRSGRLW